MKEAFPDLSENASAFCRFNSSFALLFLSKRELFWRGNGGNKKENQH